MGSLKVLSRTQRIVVTTTPAIGLTPAKTSVAVINAGPPGPRGPAGATAGAEYTQVTPSTVWTITHNLNHHPGGITVLDENGDLVLGWTATHASTNILILTFQAVVSGTAYVS